MNWYILVHSSSLILIVSTLLISKISIHYWHNQETLLFLCTHMTHPRPLTLARAESIFTTCRSGAWQDTMKHLYFRLTIDAVAIQLSASPRKLLGDYAIIIAYSERTADALAHKDNGLEQLRLHHHHH